MRTQMFQRGRTVRLNIQLLRVKWPRTMAFYIQSAILHRTVFTFILVRTSPRFFLTCIYFLSLSPWSIKLTSLNKLRQISSQPTHEMSPVFLLCVQQCYWTDLTAGCVLYHMGVCPCYHGSTLRLRIPRTSHLFSDETAISNPTTYIQISP